MTNSGARVDLPTPAPEQLFIHDVAHHLAYVNRFTGAASRAYSVASHSLWVSKWLEKWGESPEVQLAGLMHDATEAYLGDVNKPLKSLLPEYKKIEQGFWEVMAAKWGLPVELPAIVKQADHEAYLAEREVLMAWRADLLQEGVYSKSGPTVNIYVGPEEVKPVFLNRFYQLKRQIDENNYKKELSNLGAPTRFCQLPLNVFPDQCCVHGGLARDGQVRIRDTSVSGQGGSGTLRAG